MKSSHHAFLGGVPLILSVGIALAQQAAPPSPPKKSPPPAAATIQTNQSARAKMPVIGYLEGRGKVITIKAGPNGTLYDVRTKDGKVLFENATARQLQAKAPDLADFLKTGLAGAPAKGTFIDASVRPP